MDPQHWDSLEIPSPHIDVAVPNQTRPHLKNTNTMLHQKKRKKHKKYMSFQFYTDLVGTQKTASSPVHARVNNIHMHMSTSKPVYIQQSAKGKCKDKNKICNCLVEDLKRTIICSKSENILGDISFWPIF